MKRSGT